MEHQISMFDMLNPLTKQESCLRRGSGYEGGRIRIYAASMNLPERELASYLKDEYGIGGCSVEGGFMDYHSNGIKIRNWKTDETEKYSWSQVAKIVKRLIATDRYLDDKEKDRIKEIQNNHDGILPIPHARFNYE